MRRLRPSRRRGDLPILMNTQSEDHRDAVIGIDLGDKKHSICVLDKDGAVIERRTMANTPHQLRKLAARHPGGRVIMEVGTHSPWISRLMAGEGMNVLVANPRKLRAIFTNKRKCDEADAEMLARLARADLSLLSPVSHCSEQEQLDRIALKSRDSLVRGRTALCNSLRATLKSCGLRLPAGGPTALPGRMRNLLEEHPGLAPGVLPLIEVLDTINGQIAAIDRAIEALIEASYPEAGGFQKIGGVGPVTALAFRLAIGDPGRFDTARDVGAYLGLVPRRDQSGGRDPNLGISKTGNAFLRRLLVQCAHYIIGPHGQDCDLRAYGMRIAGGGDGGAKRRATVAVARKLAVLLLVLWRDSSEYEPRRRNATMAAA